jgi:F0F1-type ATP synthase assembly protein I
MPNQTDPVPQDKQRLVNMTVIALVGQVGCLTLIIVLGAVFGGMWIDRRMDTKPFGTIILVAVSVPIAIFVMLKVVRATLRKLGMDSQPQVSPKDANGEGSEENG